VLEALIAAGNGRFRGVRPWVAYSDQGLLGLPPNTFAKGVMADASFRTGVRVLGKLGLVLELWCLRTQLSEAADFASACPDTIMVLNHLASPHFRNRSRDDLGQWRSGMIELARRPNVRLKLGGLGTNVDGAMDFKRRYRPSEQLASEWKDYIETGISAFGPERSMFESNFPPDGTTCSYGAVWNTFKRITNDYSEGEKALMFSDVAKSVYRLN
jgi:predicted TIM-barrel fold metal-dependent hydrolase